MTWLSFRALFRALDEVMIEAKSEKARFYSVGLTGFEPATSASRTNESRVLSAGSKQLTSSVDDGCTNGCTNSSDIAQSEHTDTISPNVSKLLELLASNAELQSIVKAWPVIPDAVRAGVVAMVNASTGKA